MVFYLKKYGFEGFLAIFGLHIVDLAEMLFRVGHLYTYSPIRICTYTHVHIHTYTYTHVHIYLYTCTHTYPYAGGEGGGNVI